MNNKSIDELCQREKVIFQKGSFIARQGQPVDYVYYLSSGICMRTSFTPKGDEIIYDMRTADRSVSCLLGALTLYCPKDILNTNFIAKTTCICHKIPRDDFRAFLYAYPEVLHELMYLAMERYECLDKNFHSKQKGYLANRVCSFLMENLVEKDDKLWLNKRFSNSEISKYLGVHRVTIIKILKRLENDGLIRRSPDGLEIIDPKHLQTYANDQEILSYRQND